MKNHKFIRGQKGFSTMVAIFIMVILSILGIAMIKTANDDVSIAGNEKNEMAAFYAAEAGLELATATLQQAYQDENAVPSILPAGNQNVGSNSTVAFVTYDQGAASMKQLTSGSLQGLHALVKSYSLEAIGTSLVSGAQMVLSQDFECALIPIFQFAVFFNEDLWAQPAFGATITGRVHVNKNMYLRCSNGYQLKFMDRVTCGGDINAGFPSGGAGPSGDVVFVDGDGNEVSMEQGGTWIDADYDYAGVDWYDTASSLWDGNVRDASFGEGVLNLPLGGSDPHKLIERAAGNDESFENKAGLKILDGVVYSKIAGTWVDITALLPANAIVQNSSTEFYDAHEKKRVRNTQVDISILKTSSYFPDNGVIYVSDQRAYTSTLKLNATTLVNGSDLGDALTVACENPLYIKGDYNTVNKKPAATISDAITFLSNSWDPSKSSLSYSSRQASATEVNVSFITGDLAPTTSNYGGGLENLPRFLEDWDGRQFKVTGSMVEMWRSRQATGTWRYINDTDPYYSAPFRNWSFDTDLTDPSKLPPETPMVQIFQRTAWKQGFVGYSSK